MQQTEWRHLQVGSVNFCLELEWDSNTIPIDPCSFKFYHWGRDVPVLIHYIQLHVGSCTEDLWWSSGWGDDMFACKVPSLIRLRASLETPQPPLNDKTQCFFSISSIEKVNVNIILIRLYVERENSLFLPFISFSSWNETFSSLWRCAKHNGNGLVSMIQLQQINNEYMKPWCMYIITKCVVCTYIEEEKKNEM